MKFDKDQIQKIALSVLLLAFVVYGYFDMLLGPLQKSQETRRTQTVELKPKIEAANKTIAQLKASEDKAVAAQAVLKDLDAMIPGGAPVAWFPPRVADFFKDREVDKAVTRLVGKVPDKNLPGYFQSSWSIDIPKVEFASFGKALAEFENNELLVEVVNFTIEANREDVETQRVVMSVNNTVKK